MRFVAGALLVLFLPAAVGLALLFGRGGSDSEPEAVAPTAIATASANPTAPAPEPTPTREPPRGRERHVTLIDIESGVTFPLWTETETAPSIAFSPDSRWLAFGRSKLEDLNHNSAHRLDLHQSPDFEVEPIGAEYIVNSYSSQSDLALRAPGGHPAVLTIDGVMHVLANEGHARGWSPDGRWLSYVGSYHADDEEIALYLVDTETWKERLIAANRPCNCGGGPSTTWAPDSAHFIYAGAGVETLELHNPLDGTSVDIDDGIIYGWLDATHYIQYVNGDDDKDTIVSVNIQSGASETIFDAPGWTWIASDWQHIAVTEPGGRDVRIRDRKDNVVADGIRGQFGEWSPSGSLFLTYARDSECGMAALVYNVEGKLLACAPAPSYHGSGGAAISPDNHYVATIRTAGGIGASYPPPDNDVYVIELETGAERVVAEDLYGDIACIDWSPDSRFLVVGHGCSP